MKKIFPSVLAGLRFLVSSAQLSKAHSGKAKKSGNLIFSFSIPLRLKLIL